MGNEDFAFDEFMICMQLTDSSFGGSLANSMGLESCVYHNVINHSPDSLKIFIRTIIDQVPIFIGF